MNQRNTAGSIRSFIVQKFPAARKRSIDDGTPLLESGIIDSLGMLDLVAFLEQTFNITVADDELIPENFADISRMAAFADSKRNRDQASATLA
jgi:acyl carrier protein